MTSQGLQLAKDDLVVEPLQLLAALLQVAANGLHVIGKDHVTRLLTPHNHVLLPYGLLDGFQGCPDHNMETKMRRFL